MNENSVEKLRQFLIKTVLPIRRKKEEFLSKLRLSLKFRIAVNYTKLFVIFGIILLLAFGVVFLSLFDYEYDNKVEQVKSNIEKANGVFDDINSFLDEGMYVTVTSPDGHILYDEEENNFHNESNFFHKVYVSGIGEDKEFMIYRKYQVVADIDGEEKLLDVEYIIDFSRGYRLYIRTMKIMIFVVIIISIVLSISGSHQLEFIMKPIMKMSDAANKLTVNTLNSERLNVEGTKNELKDLAATINKMLDRIEVSYESQKQFVSDASHELRTPIAVIQGYVNMVDRWGKDDPSIMEESIQAIKEESENMKELVDKLLFLSRHDKKTLKLNKKLFNMGEVAREMLKETELVAKDRIITTEGIEDVNVYGDKQSLKQAIRVFIDNAIKYSEAGDTITISCKNKKGNCIICVSDTGIGMKQKDIDNIFERFYRSDNVRDKSISGHGLGLSIAKLIILKHIGTIKVTSQFEKGTTFKIILPRIYG